MTTEVNGLKINYVTKGEGDLVVLLHGWGSNLTLFSGLVDVIAAKYQVVALDLPGFGLSDEPPEPWALGDYLDFVVQFIARFEKQKVVLLGHSFGGRISIRMANEPNLPFAVEKLILVDSAGIKPKRSLKQKIKLALYKTNRTLLGLAPVRRLFPDALETLRKKNGSADYNSASEMMRQCLVRVVNEDLTHLLKSIQVPSLLIWGVNDTATPLSDGELMEKLIPDSGLVKIQHAGHYSFVDQPHIFNKVVSSFLNIKG